MPNTNKLATVLALIPKSDEQMAREIGISSKTIKRLRTGRAKPSKRILQLLLDYYGKISIIIREFIS